MTAKNLISSIIKRCHGILTEVEHELGSELAPVIIAEMLMQARVRYYMSDLENTPTFFSKGNYEPVTQDIIGTNDQSLHYEIKSYLSDLKADFYIEKNYLFHPDLSVKYMFVLESLSIEEHDSIDTDTWYNYKSKGLEHIKSVVLNHSPEKNDGVGRIPATYDSLIKNVENVHYANQTVNEHSSDIPAIEASKIVLEVIALSFNDKLYSELQTILFEESKEAPTGDIINNSYTRYTPETSNKGRLLAVAILVAAVVFLVNY